MTGGARSWSSTATCPQGQGRAEIEAMTLGEALRITTRATGLAGPPQNARIAAPESTAARLRTSAHNDLSCTTFVIMLHQPQLAPNGSARAYPAGFASRAPVMTPPRKRPNLYFYAASGLWLTSA
jgi:hypothetical protein